VTIGPEHELPLPGGSGDTDAVTVAFADPAAGLFGLARTGVTGGEQTGMGIVFAHAEPVAVRDQGVRIDVVRPLEKWKAGFDDVFDLQLEALSPPAEAALGGMESYEQLVRVRGTVAGREVDCLGQRGHSWGAPDWSKLALTRMVSAWFDTETAVSVSAVRPASARHHADEAVAATLVSGGVPMPVAEPLVSTTFDGEGRQRHAGLELWLDPEGGFPHRAAGEVLCGTTLDLGRLRLDAAFFAWRMEGRTGVGRYDVLRRAE
jgi:hypothetical protein